MILTPSNTRLSNFRITQYELNDPKGPAYITSTKEKYEVTFYYRHLAFSRAVMKVNKFSKSEICRCKEHTIEMKLPELDLLSAREQYCDI